MTWKYEIMVHKICWPFFLNFGYFSTTFTVGEHFVPPPHPCNPGDSQRPLILGFSITLKVTPKISKHCIVVTRTGVEGNLLRTLVCLARYSRGEWKHKYHDERENTEAAPEPSVRFAKLARDVVGKTWGSLIRPGLAYLLIWLSPPGLLAGTQGSQVGRLDGQMWRLIRQTLKLIEEDTIQRNIVAG